MYGQQVVTACAHHPKISSQYKYYILLLWVVGLKVSSNNILFYEVKEKTRTTRPWAERLDILSAPLVQLQYNIPI